MDRKVALTLIVPVLTVFAGAAQGAVTHGDKVRERHHSEKSQPRQEPHRTARQESIRIRVDKDRGGRDHGRLAPDWTGLKDPGSGSGDKKHHRDPSDAGNGGNRDKDDHGHYHRPPNDGDRYRHDPWHRERYEHDGHVYWRFNISLFPHYGFGIWRGGYWHRGWYSGRWGWWWVVGGLWYYYPAPIYPYPDPYVPGTVVVLNSQPAAPSPPVQASPQFWYYCQSPQGYYPYVPDCPSGWTQVAATPGNGVAPTGTPPTSQPALPPAPAPVQKPTPVQYWYHCDSPEGYYPYVKTCPGGWKKVPATPPATSASAPPSGG